MIWSQLNLIKDFLFTTLDQVLVIYFSGGILSAVFCIYVVRKVSKLIDKLR